MNEKIVRYFEFLVPLYSFLLYIITFFALFFLSLYKGNNAYFSTYTQLGIFIISIAFLIRLKAFATKKYYGSIKITGVYAIVRQPIFLSSLMILIALNLIIYNIYFLSISVGIFIVRDLTKILKFEKLLKRQYKDIYQIYIDGTYLFLPIPIRFKDVISNKVGSKIFNDNNSFILFFLIYLFLISIFVANKFLI